MTLQKKVRTRDADTGQRLEETWQTIGQPFRCSIVSDVGTEQVLADVGRETLQTHRITLQDSSRSRTINQTMRFVDRNGIVFQIIAQPGRLLAGRSRQLVFPVKETQT